MRWSFIWSSICPVGTAFTPANFILAGKDIGYNTLVDKELLHHEMGHIATYDIMGIGFYTTFISIPSVINFHLDTYNGHNNFYTEKIANTLSEFIYGGFSDKKHYPTYYIYIRQ